MGDYSFPLSCDLGFSATIQDLSLGASFIAGATETTSYYFDWRYSYNWDFEDYIMCRLSLPATFSGYVVNGIVSCNFTLTNNNSGGGSGSSSSVNAPMFFQSNGVRLSFPSDGYTNFIDETYRYSLSFDSPLPEGVSCSLLPAPSSTGDNVYYFTVSFKDFYVPFYQTGNNFSGLIEIPLKFHYYGNTVYGGQVPNGASGSPVDATHLPPEISEALVHVSPARASGSSSATWRCKLEGAGFYRDNDYYTILHALADTQYLTNASSNIASIQSLLAAWVGSSDPSSIPVDFGDFALAIYSYLSNIESSQLTSSDLSSINQSLISLISAQNTTNSNLSSLISMLDQFALSSNQADTLIGGVLQDIDVDLGEEHDIYTSSLLSFRSSLTSILNGYSGYSSVSTPATVYTGWLQSFYVSLGSFALVISAVLFGGILLRILGKVH